MLKTENQRLRNEVEFRAENERYLQEQLDDISELISLEFPIMVSQQQVNMPLSPNNLNLSN